MPNLFLTNECGRDCGFCFAQAGPWSKDYPARPLTINEISVSLDMLASDREGEVGIVGGEPLQDHRIAQIVRMAWQRNLTPKVFTSGSCPISEDLPGLVDKGNLHFVVNISPWESYTPKRQKHLKQFLNIFHKQIVLSYTLLEPELDPQFLLDYISDYHLNPFIRIGIALPAIGGQNSYVEPELYRRVGLRVVDFAQKAAKQYVQVGTDCGFVVCMFTKDEIGLLLSLGVDLSFYCRPVVDIGPELQSWSCLPLAKLPLRSLREFKSLEQVKEDFHRAERKIREWVAPGIYERCAGCRYRAHRQCVGGCLAIRLSQEYVGEQS